VCRELLLGVPPNIFPCDFESLLPTIKHISFEKSEIQAMLCEEAKWLVAKE